MAIKLPKGPALRSLRWSIRGRIAIAFTSMGAITIVLGIFAVQGADRSALLVRNTYDETVIATSYARAAAADFANMRAGFAHEVMSPTSRRAVAQQMSAALQSSFESDLATAVERSSADTRDLGAQLRKAVLDWKEVSERIAPKPASAAWDDLERRARKVEELLESFVSRVSDRGYAFRQEAQATMSREIQMTTAGVVLALAISGLVALMLYLRISAPVGAAARFANEIASGTLHGQPPQQSADEIGDLIRAMVSMRSDIGAMMSEQVVLREQSQARVAEALDGSQEGVVIADATGTIQIANRRALDFLDLTREDVDRGISVDMLVARLARTGNNRSALLRMNGSGPQTEATLLPDGRWIQNSRNRTSEGGLVALYTDITAIRAQNDRIAEANATLDAALGNMSQGLCLFDADDRLKLANSRLRALFGLAEEDLPAGTPYADMVAWALRLSEETRDPSRVQRHEQALIRRRRSLSRTILIGKRMFAVTQQPMPDGGWIATYEDVTERRRAESQVAFLANHDALTGLPNRATFAKRTEEAALRMRRGLGFAVHCLDLDRFRQVNDMLGHAVGDRLLKLSAERLRACVQEADTVARIGGDEFTILQTDVADAVQAVTLAQQVVDAMAAPFVIDGNEIAIGVNVGISMAPGDGRTHGQLLKNADAALHKAKEEGRNTWRFFEPAMDEKLQARRALEADLRRAVVQNEFEVHYQPLLQVRTSRIGCFEALVRWRHPVRGLVAPDAFIPMAEETGLIREIGAWVLRAACREAGNWPARTSVAVNVSAIQLRDPAFVQVVTDALRETGLRPERLELEITESVLIANDGKVLPTLRALRSLGIRFGMDDFGTGYSSLSTLRAFPFDKIKIDRSFVRDLDDDDAAAQIIRTILALGESLNMRVTAEGVETARQMDTLAGMGCTELQGYLIGRPVPAPQALALLAAYDEHAAASVSVAA